MIKMEEGKKESRRNNLEMQVTKWVNVKWVLKKELPIQGNNILPTK